MVSFDKATPGKISTFSADSVHYEKIDILRRTLVHEMGHGLGVEHCLPNTYCIMFGGTKNWELYGYGGQSSYGFGSAPGSCEHSPGNLWDIRLPGGLRNVIVNNQPVQVKIGVTNTPH